jgi:uncharacterized protein (DUF2164 family)
VKQPEMSEEMKLAAMERIKAYFADELDLDIGDLKARFVLDFFVEEIGQSLYNEGVRSTQEFFQKRMDDLVIDADQLLLS